MHRAFTPGQRICVSIAGCRYYCEQINVEASYTQFLQTIPRNSVEEIYSSMVGQSLAFGFSIYFGKFDDLAGTINYFCSIFLASTIFDVFQCIHFCVRALSVCMCVCACGCRCMRPMFWQIMARSYIPHQMETSTSTFGKETQLQLKWKLYLFSLTLI